MSDFKDDVSTPETAPETDMSDTSSDQETETFEDAPDTASVRSLTKRSRPSIHSQSPLSSDTEKSELEQAFQKIRHHTSTHAIEDSDEDPETTPKENQDQESQKEEEKDQQQEQKQEHSEQKEDNEHNENNEHNEHNSPTQEDSQHVAKDESPEAVEPSTSAPTAIEDAADLDVVSLDDDTAPSAKEAVVDSPPPPPEKETPPAAPTTTTTTATATTTAAAPPTAPTPTVSKSLSLSSITNVIPSIPWSPSSNSDTAKSVTLPSGSAAVSTPAPTPPLSRKLTSPFSWLSRGSSKDSSPPLQLPGKRRNTASSVTTMTSNPEMMLGKLDEEGSLKNGPSRNSLKDRFKIIRMREEAGITLLPEEEGGGPASPVSDGPAIKVTRLSVPVPGTVEEQLPPSPILTSPNPSLAPGTASGVTAGPSSVVDSQVDWDLWQAVIYEGPAAVARSSPEELSKSIATGIPSAVRGVIWQVLAQSKNEGLEEVYFNLVARGTDKEKKRQSNGHTNGTKETVASASSSVHSGDSVSGGSAPNGRAASPTGSGEKDSDSVAERKKKAKEDLAALQRLEKAIRRDLGARTSYSKFAAAQGLQEGLFGVCKAYALFDEPVGYAQGMNFLIMPLLFNMPEEEAFCLLVRLMNQYHLRELFIQDMPGLHKHLYLFERLLEDVEPALYCHLHRRGISSHLYATQWFLTLFAYRFPLQLVLRIYDLILSEGLTAILKFGIVLMQKNATTLLGMTDMSHLTTFLKDRVFDVYIDASPSAGSILENGFFGSSSSSLDKEVYRADQFVRDACEVKLTPEVVKAYTAEWEEKTRGEREREAELDNLRTTNASLAIRVRKFEERIESVDREQAALATELVRTKVENEELRDENESLKGQVRELKVVIEKQPEQLEKAWQAERDDLMGRNTRVHEESQRVEKEMAELEEELVQTKMRYAEINSQHESLTRKWSDLKRQFEAGDRDKS